jgi:hypothetical protein
MKLVYKVACADMFLGGNLCFRFGVVSHKDECGIYMPLLSAEREMLTYYLFEHRP